MSINILIVDDYPSVRAMVRSQLKKIGLKGDVYEAESVKRAKEILEESFKQNKYIDFIITDWLMPEENGIELIKYARGSKNFNNIPMLVLTTENEKSVVLDTITAGASNYLLKPWSLEGLQDKMETCWSKHHPKSK